MHTLRRTEQLLNTLTPRTRARAVTTGVLGVQETTFTITGAVLGLPGKSGESYHGPQSGRLRRPAPSGDMPPAHAHYAQAGTPPFRRAG